MRILFLLITFLSLQTFAQINFENGYFIDNNNVKTTCLIKNEDWKDNPTSFVFKTSENENSITATIENVNEFGIDGKFKFIKRKVEIDRTSEIVSELTNEKRPDFKNELLFLKVLIEGKASLYMYEESRLTKYFYSINNDPIEQLVCKSYLTESGLISKNNQYKQQLLISMKCDGIDIKRIENLKYYKSDLSKFFIEFNTCDNATYVNFDKKIKQDLINLSIRPRFVSSSLFINSLSSTFYNFDFGNKISPGLGIELELIFPFNKNKWAVVIEPTYQHFDGEKRRSVQNSESTFFIGKVNYTSIDLPISIRHYFYLNQNSKIFVNVGYVADLLINSSYNVSTSINPNENLESIDLDTDGVISLGIGFKYMDKYSIEFRHHTKRNVLTNYSNYNTEFNTSAFIIGYTLF
jgi:hypothetical protein